MSEFTKVQIKQLYNITYKAMKHFGMSDEDADIMADMLSVTDARGMRSHGLSRFSQYFPILAADPEGVKGDMTVLSETPSTIYMRGTSAMGIVTAAKANRAVIAKAKETGICIGSITGGAHCGMTGYYPLKANEEGLIGFFSSGTVQLVVPAGGAKPVLGNMPFCISVPGGKEYYKEPINLDTCCSMVATGKIMNAMKLGQKIPTDWVLDRDGNPTDDPAEFMKSFACMPFGGYKGSGITIMLEILSSVLSGSGFDGDLVNFPTKENPDNYGYLILAIDPTKFLSADEFAAGVDRYARMIKECPPAPGAQEVFLPGEIEARKYRKAVEEGIDYETGLLLDELSQLKKYGILPEEATVEDMLNM